MKAGGINKEIDSKIRSFPLSSEHDRTSESAKPAFEVQKIPLHENNFLNSLAGSSNDQNLNNHTSDL